MIWLQERWGIIRDAIGTKRYGLADITKLVVGLAGIISVAIYGVDMTPIAKGAIIIAIILFFVAWYLLEYALKLKKQISDSRVQLSELRHKGVRLRNKARSSIVDKESWALWEQEANAWFKTLIKEMNNISEADAMWLLVLDVVPPPRLSVFNVPEDKETTEKFLKLYGEHDYRLRHLGKMIRDLWGKV